MIKRISKRIIPLAVLGAALGTLTLPASAETAAEGKADRTIANFNLAKCESIDVNIYRCPAVDKPICTSDYAGSLQCIRTDKKGRVIVMGPAPADE